MVSVVNLPSRFVLETVSYNQALFMPDLNVRGIQGPVLSLSEFLHFQGYMLITIRNQYARQNGTLLKSLGRNGRLGKYRLKSSVFAG